MDSHECLKVFIDEISKDKLSNRTDLSINCTEQLDKCSSPSGNADTSVATKSQNDLNPQGSSSDNVQSPSVNSNNLSVRFPKERSVIEENQDDHLAMNVSAACLLDKNTQPLCESQIEGASFLNDNNSAEKIHELNDETDIDLNALPSTESNDNTAAVEDTSSCQECSNDPQCCSPIFEPTPEVFEMNERLSSSSQHLYLNSESEILDVTEVCASSSPFVTLADNRKNEFESMVCSSKEDVDMSENIDSLNIYRGAVVPYSDTDDSASSSSSSSCDSSSDESEESESDSADNENTIKTPYDNRGPSPSSKPIKVQGELDLEDLPPIQDLHISVRNDQVSEIGKILHIVDSLVVVESYKDQPPLDLDSVLFLDCGARPLGRIFDVMGPVTEPLYCIRFNSKSHVEEHNVNTGMLVYCAPQTEHSNFVFVKQLIMMKGSDASWKKDIEVPVSQIDFSDDEQEHNKKKEGKNCQKAAKTKCSDEPQVKVGKMEWQHAAARDHLNIPRPQCRPEATTSHPRNPWSHTGAMNNFQSHDREQRYGPNQPSRSYSQGHIMPSSFTIDSQTPFSKQVRMKSSAPSHVQFGSTPDPRNFRQAHRNVSIPQRHDFQRPPNFSRSQSNFCRPPPPTWNNYYSPSWQSNEGYLPVGSQGNGNNHHGQSNTCWSSSQPSMSNQYQENNRYLAFQSEIARLVQAYNNGAESPMALPPPPFGLPPPDNRNAPY